MDESISSYTTAREMQSDDDDDKNSPPASQYHSTTSFGNTEREASNEHPSERTVKPNLQTSSQQGSESRATDSYLTARSERPDTTPPLNTTYRSKRGAYKNAAAARIATERPLPETPATGVDSTRRTYVPGHGIRTHSRQLTADEIAVAHANVAEKLGRIPEPFDPDQSIAKHRDEMARIGDRKEFLEKARLQLHEETGKSVPSPGSGIRKKIGEREKVSGRGEEELQHKRSSEEQK